MSSSVIYSPLAEKEESEQAQTADDRSEFSVLGEGRPFAGEKRRNVRRYGYWVAYCGSVLAMSGLLFGIQQSLHNDQRGCWDKFNYYLLFNSSCQRCCCSLPLCRSTIQRLAVYQSPFKGPPTPDVERAWYDIMKYGLINVAKEDIEKVKHAKWSAQFPPEAGGGYIAATIGSHQLHCLHYIWQDHYMEYFPKTQDKKQRVPELYERHHEHCVDYIWQCLMCQFDTGIIPYNWVLDHQNPTPNANTHHKCVNWDALQNWLGNRTVEVPEGFQWYQPEDAAL